MSSLFRVVALLEGLSYIMLLFVAMPVKYFMDDPQYVKLLGMPHGILFILYIALAFVVKTDSKWSNNTFLMVLAASIIPFGTIYIDKKYLSPTS